MTNRIVKDRDLRPGPPQDEGGGVIQGRFQGHHVVALDLAPDRIPSPDLVPHPDGIVGRTKEATVVVHQFVFSGVITIKEEDDAHTIQDLTVVGIGIMVVAVEGEGANSGIGSVIHHHDLGHDLDLGIVDQDLGAFLHVITGEGVVVQIGCDGPHFPAVIVSPMSQVKNPPAVAEWKLIVCPNHTKIDRKGPTKFTSGV